MKGSGSSFRSCLSWALRWFVLPAIALAAGSAWAAPEWRHAINRTLKLHGGVLLGDERGTYWDDRLPEGWEWLGPPNAPFDDPGAGYSKCDQLRPVVENGAVVFETSKWNFLQMALNAGASEEQLGRRLVELEGARTFRFRRDPGISAATALFASMAPDAARKALESPAETAKIPHMDFGVLVLRTRAGTVFKVLVENYGATVALTWAALADDGPTAKFGANAISPCRRQGNWQRDLDGDGAPDLGWSGPGDAYAPLGGATLAPIQSFKYP